MTAPHAEAPKAGGTGADALVRTLRASGVEVCFTNPGTSEMHLVGALERTPGMRGVLALFEGVASGAADGYARMAGRPAWTLLHLGPGLGNAIANLHNARRARVPVVNVVGEHARAHRALDAPLTADIEGLAHPVSGWVRTSRSARDLGADAAAAVAASWGPPGRVATLIVPADVAWGAGADPSPPVPRPVAFPPEAATVAMIAERLRSGGREAALLMNGAALSESGIRAAGRIAARTGVRLLADTFVTRMSRGAGRVAVPKLPYRGPEVTARLTGLRDLILVGTRAPVAFFAYPDEPGDLTPPDCRVHTLARPDEDPVAALRALVEALGAGAVRPAVAELERPEAPTGPLDPDRIARALACHLPEGAVLVNEGGTEGHRVYARTRGVVPHEWLDLTGGAIGMGLPAATGAAVAAPDRRVVALQADGSALYTVQALWTQARESLDVTTILLANRRYALLEEEYRLTGAGEPSERVRQLLELTPPTLDWVALARGFGVPSVRVESAEALSLALARSFSEPGPFLVEAVL